MSCLPCEYKRQRLKAKYEALKERARTEAKAKGYETILIYQFHAEEDDGPDEPRYGFGSTTPAGAVPVELLRVD